MRVRGAILAATLAAFWCLSPAGAQELEPRAYRPLPVGLHFGLLAYSFSSGNVLVDPTIPVEGLELDLSTLVGSYVHTFSLLERSSSVALVVPYVFASGSGQLNGVFTQGSRSGPADARLRLTVNMLGGPAMSPAEFAKHRPKRSLGASLTVAIPNGQYEAEKVVNFGANRWGFKPEIGYSSQRGRWITDLAAGAWLFTSNDDGPGGATMRQDPIGSFQTHLSYNFKNGKWLALNANYFTGGRSSLDGIDAGGLQRNSRIGLTFSIPLHPRDSIKVSAHTGAITRAGADFDIGGVTYQRRFGGSGRPAQPGS